LIFYLFFQSLGIYEETSLPPPELGVQVFTMYSI
jgi:hypothetical protein